MKRPKNITGDCSHQKGVALLLGLVLLAAISLLAVVTSASMIVQQRMAGNFSDAQSARQAAAWAVAEGEDYLFGVGQDQRADGCSVRCFLPPAAAVIHQPEDLPTYPENEGLAWWRTWGSIAANTPTGEDAPGEELPGLWPFSSEAPRYLISEVQFETDSGAATAIGAPPIDGVAYYRILGLGLGRNPSVQAVDEAIIARPWLGAYASSADPEPGGDYCAPYKPWYDCGRMSWRQRR